MVHRDGLSALFSTQNNNLVSALSTSKQGTHKLLINLPDSENRFVRAPIKCRRWRPHYRISSTYTRFVIDQRVTESRSQVKERGFYTAEPLNYLLSDICWNSFPGRGHNHQPHDKTHKNSSSSGAPYYTQVVPANQQASNVHRSTFALLAIYSPLDVQTFPCS